jgi:hypothetical protein
VNAGDQFSMPVHWREWDWECLREAVREESGIQRPLAACGLLKFFDCPLIRSQEYLLQCLISMWSTDLQCFIVRGKQLTFSAMEDVYFLTGLPFQGMALPVDPQLPGDVHLVDFGTEVLFGAEHYVRFGHPHRGDGCALASVHHNDDCEDLQILSDSADQWWSAEDYAESIGWRFFRLGLDVACQDDGAD